MDAEEGDMVHLQESKVNALVNSRQKAKRKGTSTGKSIKKFLAKLIKPVSRSRPIRAKGMKGRDSDNHKSKSKAEHEEHHTSSDCVARCVPATFTSGFKSSFSDLLEEKQDWGTAKGECGIRKSYHESIGQKEFEALLKERSLKLNLPRYRYKCKRGNYLSEVQVLPSPLREPVHKNGGRFENGTSEDDDYECAKDKSDGEDEADIDDPECEVCEERVEDCGCEEDGDEDEDHHEGEEDSCKKELDEFADGCIFFSKDEIESIFYKYKLYEKMLPCDLEREAELESDDRDTVCYFDCPNSATPWREIKNRMGHDPGQSNEVDLDYVVKYGNPECTTQYFGEKMDRETHSAHGDPTTTREQGWCFCPEESDVLNSEDLFYSAGPEKKSRISSTREHSAFQRLQYKHPWERYNNEDGNKEENLYYDKNLSKNKGGGDTCSSKVSGANYASNDWYEGPKHRKDCQRYRNKRRFRKESRQTHIINKETAGFVYGEHHAKEYEDTGSRYYEQQQGNKNCNNSEDNGDQSVAPGTPCATASHSLEECADELFMQDTDSELGSDQEESESPDDMYFGLPVVESGRVSRCSSVSSLYAKDEPAESMAYTRENKVLERSTETDDAGVLALSNKFDAVKMECEENVIPTASNIQSIMNSCKTRPQSNGEGDSDLALVAEKFNRGMDLRPVSAIMSDGEDRLAIKLASFAHGQFQYCKQMFRTAQTVNQTAECDNLKTDIDERAGVTDGLDEESNTEESALDDTDTEETELETSDAIDVQDDGKVDAADDGDDEDDSKGDNDEEESEEDSDEDESDSKDDQETETETEAETERETWLNDDRVTLYNRDLCRGITDCFSNEHNALVANTSIVLAASEDECEEKNDNSCESSEEEEEEGEEKDEEEESVVSKTEEVKASARESDSNIDKSSESDQTKTLDKLSMSNKLNQQPNISRHDETTFQSPGKFFGWLMPKDVSKKAGLQREDDSASSNRKNGAEAKDVYQDGRKSTEKNYKETDESEDESQSEQTKNEISQSVSQESAPEIKPLVLPRRWKKPDQGRQLNRLPFEGLFSGKVIRKSHAVVGTLLNRVPDEPKSVIEEALVDDKSDKEDKDPEKQLFTEEDEAMEENIPEATAEEKDIENLVAEELASGYEYAEEDEAEAVEKTEQLEEENLEEQANEASDGDSSSPENQPHIRNDPAFGMEEENLTEKMEMAQESSSDISQDNKSKSANVMSPKYKITDVEKPWKMSPQQKKHILEEKYGLLPAHLKAPMTKSLNWRRSPSANSQNGKKSPVLGSEFLYFPKPTSEDEVKFHDALSAQNKRLEATGQAQALSKVPASHEITSTGGPGYVFRSVNGNSDSKSPNRSRSRSRQRYKSKSTSKTRLTTTKRESPTFGKSSNSNRVTKNRRSISRTRTNVSNREKYPTARKSPSAHKVRTGQRQMSPSNSRTSLVQGSKTSKLTRDVRGRKSSPTRNAGQRRKSPMPKAIKAQEYLEEEEQEEEELISQESSLSRNYMADMSSRAKAAMATRMPVRRPATVNTKLAKKSSVKLTKNTHNAAKGAWSDSKLRDRGSQIPKKAKSTFSHKEDTDKDKTQDFSKKYVEKGMHGQADRPFYHLFMSLDENKPEKVHQQPKADNADATSDRKIQNRWKVDRNGKLFKIQECNNAVPHKDRASTKHLVKNASRRTAKPNMPKIMAGREHNQVKRSYVSNRPVKVDKFDANQNRELPAPPPLTPVSEEEHKEESPTSKVSQERPKPSPMMTFRIRSNADKAEVLPAGSAAAADANQSTAGSQVKPMQSLYIVKKEKVKEEPPPEPSGGFFSSIASLNPFSMFMSRKSEPEPVAAVAHQSSVRGRSRSGSSSRGQTGKSSDKRYPDVTEMSSKVDAGKKSHQVGDKPKSIEVTRQEQSKAKSFESTASSKGSTVDPERPRSRYSQPVREEDPVPKRESWQVRAEELRQERLRAKELKWDQKRNGPTKHTENANESVQNSSTSRYKDGNISGVSRSERGRPHPVSYMHNRTSDHSSGSTTEEDAKEPCRVKRNMRGNWNSNAKTFRRSDIKDSNANTDADVIDQNSNNNNINANEHKMRGDTLVEGKPNDQHVKKVSKQLEKRMNDGTKLFSTLELLIEWQVISMGVLLLLFIGMCCPCALHRTLSCPVPSFCAGVRNTVSKPFGMASSLKRPSVPSFWSGLWNTSKPAPVNTNTAFPSSSLFSRIVAWPFKTFALSLTYALLGLINAADTLVRALMFPFRSGANSRPSQARATEYEETPQYEPMKFVSDDEDDGSIGPNLPINQHLERLRGSSSFLLYFGFDEINDCNMGLLKALWLQVIGNYPQHC